MTMPKRLINRLFRAVSATLHALPRSAGLRAALIGGHSHKSHLNDGCRHLCPQPPGSVVLSIPPTEGSAPINHLPSPLPVFRHPALMDLFAALGWLCRSAQAVGSDRFAETARRSGFYLDKAASNAHTPAELAVITSLTASQDALILADADARELLANSVVGITDACATEVAQLLDNIEGV